MSRISERRWIRNGTAFCAASRSRYVRLRSQGPADILERRPIPLPKMDAVMVRTSYDAQAVGRSVETRMSQETASVLRQVVSPHVQPNQAVAGVAQPAEEEILVLSEEREVPLPVQERHDVFVLHPTVAEVKPDLPKRNPPRTKHCALVVREVLVEEVQAATVVASGEDLEVSKPPPLSSQASRESLTASATAASGMRPPHLVLQMKSQDRPSARSSSTCHTMIRVPLNVGLPWQIAGSATINRPSSTRRARPAWGRFFPFLTTQN